MNESSSATTNSFPPACAGRWALGSAFTLLEGGLNCLQVSLDNPQFNSATVYTVAHITEFHWHLAPPHPSLEWQRWALNHTHRKV